VTWNSPDTYQSAGLERGTATSKSTTTGTTSVFGARILEGSRISRVSRIGSSVLAVKLLVRELVAEVKALIADPDAGFV
jgi:hypothetical protein